MLMDHIKISKMELNITFPVIESYSSERYALIIIDSASVTHYWDFDGSYDGYSTEIGIDGETGTCSN